MTALTKPDHTSVSLLLYAKRAQNPDTARLDWLADDRVFDGIGGMDIDDMTLAAVPKESGEEAWQIEWRKQMRIAIDATRKARLRGPRS